MDFSCKFSVFAVSQSTFSLQKTWFSSLDFSDNTCPVSRLFSVGITSNLFTLVSKIKLSQLDTFRLLLLNITEEGIFIMCLAVVMRFMDNGHQDFLGICSNSES